jgi:flavin reductase (DIM6/NTAB) family NADH-FMN oxidoreductase RutF
MYFDTTDTAAYKVTLLNAIVAPRPIGWVTSIDRKGRVNLAPFSYFNGVSTDPPRVLFCANEPADRAEKDTLANVREVPEFVANFANWDLREAMNLSATTAPRGVDELALAGLTPMASTKVLPPGVAESPVHLECRVVQIVDLAASAPDERRSTVVIGAVVGIHIDDALLDANGRFDTAAARPIARLGGFAYATLGEIFDMPRPPWPLERDDSDTRE